MTPEQFLQEVRDRAAFGHMVKTSTHAIEKMRERNLTSRMVLNVLRRADELHDGIQWNNDYGNWQGKIVGTTAGTRLAIVCGISDGDLYVSVVTTYKTG